jgi:hypothetical protein
MREIFVLGIGIPTPFQRSWKSSRLWMGTTVAWKTHSSEEVHKLIQGDSVRILV